MKNFKVHIFLNIFVLAIGTCVHGQVIKKVCLDSNNPMICPVHPMCTLTMTFPKIPEAVSGMGFSMETNTKNKGDYWLQYQPGTNYLSISPRSDQAQPRNLNVIIEGKNYVFYVHLVGDPNDALMSLILSNPIPVDDNLKIKPGAKIGLSKSKLKPKAQTQPVNPSQLISLIETLKLMSAITKPQQKELAKLMSHLEVNLGAKERIHYGSYIIIIEKVIRHNAIDAMAFELSIQNTQHAALSINPETFSVRICDCVYDQITSDSPTSIGPMATQKAYFVICGNGAGEPNWLSTDNKFIVSVDAK